jgi:hypothetical protein
MVYIDNADQMNPLEVMLVADYMEKRGEVNYSMRPGNDCIWVSSGSASVPINRYFIFKDGKMVDIQID